MEGLFLSFVKNEDGATAIEYALIASILSIGIVGSLQALAPAISANFATVETGMN